MNEQQKTKPQYGRRLLVNILDDVARKDPQRTWLMIPRSGHTSDGWKPVTFKTAANAINRIARKLTEIMGTPAKGQFPTIAYIGPSDVRYVIIMFGAVKAGYKALFLSPRNSHEAQHSLLERTDCHMLLFAPSSKALIQPWLQERHLDSVQVSSVEVWLDERPVPPFPCNKTWDEARWDPLVVLHTSGSTGIPKPIVVRQGMLSIDDAFHDLPDKHGTRFFTTEVASRIKRLLIPLPLFHARGLYVTSVMPLHWNTTMVLGVGNRPLSSDLVVEYLKSVDVDGIGLPPSILEEMSLDPEQTKTLAKLKLAIFLGGELAPEVGDKLVRSGVGLANVIGTTEFAPYPLYWQPNPELWRWFIFNSEVFGCDWRKTDEDSVSEQVIVRKDKDPGLQGFFYTFPDTTEYNTRDLYRKHPTLPDHWIYHGRSDNIIVFSNGEKLNPISIEAIVVAHPAVKGALVVGTKRFQPALIVEPAGSYPQDKKQEGALLDKVWPLVVQANRQTVAHGQIGRKFVALSDPEKPFLRTGKGTIQRAATLKLYEDDIDEIYKEAVEASSVETTRVDVSSEGGLVISIINIFTTSLDLDATKLGPDTDLFSAGVDSLQVINAARLLRSSLDAEGIHVSTSKLATRVIYSNPTPRRLAHYLFMVVREGDTSSESAAQHEIHAMKSQIAKYTSDLPVAKQNKPPPEDNEQTILLTGSTGALGSYLLDFMLSSPRVKKVICLNRSEDGRARQERMSQARGLSTSFDKAEFYHADLGQFHLGLGKEAYDDIRDHVDRIIHNQWPVNFNMSVESFEPHVRGVRHLVDLSAHAKKRGPTVFISSISVAEDWKETGPVPEESLRDLTIAHMGYGRSKLVSSLIIEEATCQSGVPTEIIRVGQIAASSVSLGVLPSDLGIMDVVDWTPIERIAKMVLEASGVVTPVPISEVKGYFHGVNAKTTTWEKLAPAVKEFYGGKIKKLVPFTEWIEIIEKSAAGTDDVREVPAIKLLDTYKAWSRAGGKHIDFAMTRTAARSKAMAESEPVSPELMRNWCRQWAF
ncbi:hypothetical protein GE09DRAFT_1172045 [Coniochaeta sp. 2T2.1]|nr:hypothetical protein GE09DRAFT_1172045 [Coniochaeta sp. 2T2.1]